MAFLGDSVFLLFGNMVLHPPEHPGFNRKALSFVLLFSNLKVTHEPNGNHNNRHTLYQMIPSCSEGFLILQLSYFVALFWCLLFVVRVGAGLAAPVVLDC